MKILSVFYKQDLWTDVCACSVTIQMGRKHWVVMATKCIVPQMKKKYIKERYLSCQLLYHGSSCWIWVLLSWNFNTKSSRLHFSLMQYLYPVDFLQFGRSEILQISLLWEALAFSSLVIYLNMVSLLNEHGAVSNRWIFVFSWSSS